MQGECFGYGVLPCIFNMKIFAIIGMIAVGLLVLGLIALGVLMFLAKYLSPKG